MPKKKSADEKVIDELMQKLRALIVHVDQLLAEMSPPPCATPPGVMREEPINGYHAPPALEKPVGDAKTGGAASDRCPRTVGSLAASAKNDHDPAHLEEHIAQTCGLLVTLEALVQRDDDYWGQTSATDASDISSLISDNKRRLRAAFWGPDRHC